MSEPDVVDAMDVQEADALAVIFEALQSHKLALETLERNMKEMARRIDFTMKTMKVRMTRMSGLTDAQGRAIPGEVIENTLLGLYELEQQKVMTNGSAA